MGAYHLKSGFYLKDRLAQLNHFKVNELIIEGNANIVVQGVASIFDGEKNCISYCLYDDPQKADTVLQCRSTVIVAHIALRESLREERPSDTVYIFSDNPKLLFVDLMQWPKEGNIAQSAIIHSTVQLGKNISIGENAVIDEGVIIGDNTVIGSLVHIGQDTIIGQDVQIRSGAVIGETGLSFAVKDGKQYQVPSFGKVVVGDRVNIGANAVVIRGFFADTVIEEGTKIGNLANIGHEVNIGRNNFISVAVSIAGGAKIGNNCWIGPGTTILQKVKIGDEVKVAIGSLLVKDVKTGLFVGGVPARAISSAAAKENMV